MTVIAFKPRLSQHDGPWPADELKQIVESLAAPLSRGEAGGWDVGVTEVGDPQFYLLGRPPQDECLLCISRLGRLYLLEDGRGQVLFEHNSLLLLAEQARTVLRKKKAQIVARLGLAWCAIRGAFEEKLDAMVVEGEEVLTHCVPQLAVLV